MTLSRREFLGTAAAGVVLTVPGVIPAPAADEKPKKLVLIAGTPSPLDRLKPAQRSKAASQSSPPPPKK